MSLQGQVALVSGASRGIGQAIAKHLAHAGATVVGTATTAAGAATITQYLGEIGNNGKGLALNVNEVAQIESVIDTVQSEYGAILILVNNAGITRDNLLMRMRDDEWDDIIDTNLRSVFRLSRAVLRGMMKAKTGRIINISSVVGAAGNAGQTNYAAAKAGMIGFTKALAREVGSRNITVNCVAPGFIDTDMTRALTEVQHRALLANIPLSRLGSVDDIAAAAGYLASPGAAYVTGITLHVNGGMYMS